MFDKYILCVTGNDRIPIEIRQNKGIAREFLQYIISNNINIKNSAIYTLASWCEFEIDKYKPNSLYSRIKEIKYSDNEEVVGDFTVPNGNSYIANGIIVHNCNLPSSATRELVAEVYMKAWESGCKGFTVYRDGSRSGVLVSEESAKKSKKSSDGRPDEIEHVMAPKRPQELLCDIKKVKVNGESWVMFVGLFNGKPYEIFGGLSKFVEIPNKCKTGKIFKNGKNQDGVTSYNLVLGEGDDQITIKDIASIFENKNYEAVTRIISLNLRHGTPIQYIVEQLTKDKYAEMTSFTKVIARVLKSYVKDGAKSGDKQCPSCKMEGTLVYQEGCNTCTNCKYSKCG